MHQSLIPSAGQGHRITSETHQIGDMKKSMGRTNRNVQKASGSRHGPCHTLVIAALLGLAFTVPLVASGGCDHRSKNHARKERGKAAVPNPLEHPAEFCFTTCARRTYCRLGKPEGKEQLSLFAKEKARCIQGCIRWMKGHPFDALAYHGCYRKKTCSHMTACLAETRRLLQAAADPDRKRQCLSLCVDFGQCNASERRCMERCKAPDLAIYRAMEHCENRSCPAVRDCVLQYVPALQPTKSGPQRSPHFVGSSAMETSRPAANDQGGKGPSPQRAHP